MIDLTRRAVGYALFWLTLTLATSTDALQTTTAPYTYPTLNELQNAEIVPRDRLALARELRGLTVIPAVPTTAPDYAIGDRATFSVLNLDDNQVMSVEAQLVALGEHIALWFPAHIQADPVSAQALADAFDARIYDAVRSLWGSEAIPGVDGDPRVHGLFAYNVGSGTRAYFSADNTYPVEVSPTSSEHEMFVYNLDITGTSVGTPADESTTAHEFQHMIRHNMNPNLDSWLDEGFSTFTQLYLGYTDAARYGDRYMGAPWTQLNTWQSGAHYGASMLFVTYIQETCGLEALKQFSLAVRPGHARVDSVLQEQCGIGFNDLFADWVVTNQVRDAGLGYGYDNPILAGLPAPFSVAEVLAYPYTRTATAAQHSAHYYHLENLPDSGTLHITLDAPQEVVLIPTQGEGAFWYSNRADDSAMHLTRPFDLTHAQSAVLTFDVWYQLEALWDYAYVLVSTDDGLTWDMLETAHMTHDNPHGTAYGPGYTGESPGWIEETVALDAYVGREILLRFALITDEATNLPGIAVDNVILSADAEYSADFNNDSGGWTASGWVRTDNRLPQRAWVQIIAQTANGIDLERALWPDDFANAARSLTIQPEWEKVRLAISPLAPVTTVDMPYTLTLTTE